MNYHTFYGSDMGNQFVLGASVGKWFDFGRFGVMPNVGLKHTQSTGTDYYLDKFNGDTVSADDVILVLLIA